MTNRHGYPETTPEVRALYNKKNPTATDLLAMATIEADHAMRSLPPHCLPTEGGLPHNPDHANAAAHRCWSFLKRVAGLVETLEGLLGEARHSVAAHDLMLTHPDDLCARIDAALDGGV